MLAGGSLSLSLEADLRYPLAHSLSPDAARIEAIVLVFEHKQRIRALIKAFADEKDPQRLKALAAELEQLLTLESKPWSLRDDKAK